MAAKYFHFQLYALILSFFSSLSHSFKLQPIVSTATHSLAARAVPSTSLGLQTSESFLWGGATGDRAALATLTVYTSDETESIVNLERLQDLTSSIRCSNDTVTLQFSNNRSAYTQLHENWSWINQALNNTLILVAGAGQCGWNEDRQPFTISSVSYNNVTLTAVLSGSRVDWKDVASNYDLHVGAVPQPDLAQRDYTGDCTVSFNHQLGFGNWSFPINPQYSVGLTCKTCYTTGYFAFDFDIKAELGIPVDASLTIIPQDLSVVLDPTISLSGNIGGSLSFKDTFLRIPIDGITVASIVDLGPEIAFTGALNIGPLEGSASVTTGVNVSVENSAKMYMDLLSPSKFNASGWTPQVTGLTPTVSASIGAGISLSLLADVEFDLKVLGEGLSAGIGIQPLVGATLSAIDSPSGACAKDSEHRALGVQLAPSAGVWFLASVSDVATVTITSETISLPTDCIGIGSPLTPSSPVIATTSSAVVTSIPTTSLLPSSSFRSPSLITFRTASRTPSTTPSPAWRTHIQKRY